MSKDHITYRIDEAITLCLMKVKGIGPKTIANFWAKLDASSAQLPNTVEELHELLTKTLKKVPSLALLSIHWSEALELIGLCQRESITILGRTNPLPPQICRISNPPLLLFVEGSTDPLFQKGIAVIGAREATDYAKKVGRKMSATLAESGWCIFSGLAEGCDTVGHQGALDVDGKTVAILAHGFGKIYPASNKGLAVEIVEKGGCLVSEYPPGTPASRGSFVQRDRLQSGLSQAIIVLETDIKGGTMHTVGFAVEEGRPIATLNHPAELLDEPKTQGNQLLIRDGRAVSISNKQDLIDFVAGINPSKIVEAPDEPVTSKV